MRATTIAVSAVLLCSAASQASADQLYSGDAWAGVASDIKARRVGDLLTIVINEAATATNKVGTRSSRSTSLDGGFQAGGVDETARLGFDRNYRGQGETERSDRFAASITASVIEILPNGELVIEGQQHLLVNGEKRDIKLRGRVRPVDITPENLVLSNRLAGAEIQYDGKGFVTRSAKPGLINRIFALLGL